MNHPIVGAHDVTERMLFATARWSGLLSVLGELLATVWIAVFGADIFDNRSWVPLMEVARSYWVVAAIVCVGGVCGVLGLVCRNRWLSVASAAIGAAWCGWLGAFLLVAHFTGHPNFACLFALGGVIVFLLRVVLLSVVPQDGEPRGVGW